MEVPLLYVDHDGNPVYQLSSIFVPHDPITKERNIAYAQKNIEGEIQEAQDKEARRQKLRKLMEARDDNMEKAIQALKPHEMRNLTFEHEYFYADTHS